MSESGAMLGGEAWSSGRKLLEETKFTLVLTDWFIQERNTIQAHFKGTLKLGLSCQTNWRVRCLDKNEERRLYLCEIFGIPCPPF